MSEEPESSHRPISHWVTLMDASTDTLEVKRYSTQPFMHARTRVALVRLRGFSSRFFLVSHQPDNKRFTARRGVGIEFAICTSSRMRPKRDGAASMRRACQ